MKQYTISLSSAEAEYRFLRRLTSELAWLSRLLHDIDPIALKCDNHAAIYIANDPVYHQRIKYIELDCHFVRAKLESGQISLSYTPSKDQFANICTKSLIGSQHHHLLASWVCLFHPPTWEKN